MTYGFEIDDDQTETGPDTLETGVGGRVLLVLSAMLALALAACGGNPAANNDGSDSETTTASDGNYAIVTVGATTYEVPADALNLCNSLDNLIFGSFALDASGAVTQAGGADVAVQVNFGIPAPDWQDQGLQAPVLDVDLRDEGIRWWASIDRGLGSVDSWELDSGQAVGQASFVGEEAGTGNEVGTESGSFEIVCR